MTDQALDAAFEVACYVTALGVFVALPCVLWLWRERQRVQDPRAFSLIAEGLHAWRQGR